MAQTPPAGLGKWLASAGDDSAERRNGGHGIGVIKAIEKRRVDARELKGEEPPAALEHTISLAQRLVDARHIADAEGDRIGVEMIARQRQILGIALNEGDSRPGFALGRALAADPQHIAIDVE